jgi:hypothetical protein
MFLKTLKDSGFLKKEKKKFPSRVGVSFKDGKPFLSIKPATFGEHMSRYIIHNMLSVVTLGAVLQFT